MANEWEDFDFDVDGDNSYSIETVTHIAHTKFACRIIEDGAIKSSLVYDESKLNKHRVSVTWFSANEWVYGSIYGTTKFTFLWKDIIAGKEPYWVEVIRNYSPPAFRILFASVAPDTAIAIPYDPKTAKGPLKFKDGVWYRHKDYCSEFLVDRDVSVKEAESIKFVQHNYDRCRFGKKNCPDAGLPFDQSRARVSAFLLARRKKLLSLTDQLTTDVRGERRIHADIEPGFHILADSLMRGGSFKELIPDSDVEMVRSVVESAIASYSYGNYNEARKAVSSLSSSNGFQVAFDAIVSELCGAEFVLSE